MRIAIPITATTVDDALKDMDVATPLADILELRLDYMSRPNLEVLLRHCAIPKIVTNRTKHERGRFQGSEERRIAYLQEAIDLGAEYIDIESDYFHNFERKSTKLIVSHHNFENTPQDLDSIYRWIVSQGADIVKIATTAKDYTDSLRMLQLIAAADRDIIGICMGEKGSLTRVLGPVYGGYLTFACLTDDKASASGQMTVAQLQQASKLLRCDSG